MSAPCVADDGDEAAEGVDAIACLRTYPALAFFLSLALMTLSSSLMAPFSPPVRPSISSRMRQLGFFSENTACICVALSTFDMKRLAVRSSL